MSSVNIHNARIIDPAYNSDAQGDLHISSGRIAVDNGKKDDRDYDIDASGLIACPGFIDLYGRLRQPGFSRKGTIASESYAAMYAGFTTIFCAPDTSPVIDSSATVELIRQHANNANGARVLPIAALTANLAGKQLSELATLFEAGCLIASNADCAVANTGVMHSIMEYAASFDIPILINPVDASIAGNGCAHAGAVATRMGLSGIPVAAETVALSSLIELCRDTGARMHLSRLSSARGVELVRMAKQEGLPVSCDVGINHLFFTEQQLVGFDVNFHSAVPFRSSDDRAGLRAGLKDGTIDVICSDHAPHDTDSKLAPFPNSGAGLSVYDVFLPLLLSLPKLLGMNLPAVLSRVSCNPASVVSDNTDESSVLNSSIKPPQANTAIGSLADLILFDPGTPVQINTELFSSMGHNSPLDGLSNLMDCTGEDVPLQGKVLHCLVDGVDRLRVD